MEVLARKLSETPAPHVMVGSIKGNDSVHDFRLYMLVGGMPQAVNANLETNNLSAVDAVKREIIELYADNFRKIDPTGKATRMFYAVPEQLNKMRHAIRFRAC